MAESPRLGAKVRALRRRERLTQAQLAARLGISASYLNLIENNRRPLTARLLIELARHFGVDINAFADDDEPRLVDELMEAFSTPRFDSYRLVGPDIREFVAAHPGMARAVLDLHRTWQSTRDQRDAVAEAYRHAYDEVERLSAGDAGQPISLPAPQTIATDPPTAAEVDPDALPATGARLPAEEVSDALQRARNHFPPLEYAADKLRDSLGPVRRDLVDALLDHLRVKGITVTIEPVAAMPHLQRRFDPERRLLQLSEALPRTSLTFQLAHQIALMDASAALDALVEEAPLGSAPARTLFRVALANYFAGAVVMPYAPFIDAARANRYDIEVLGHRFGASWEQVCHRLTTLGRPGNSGLAFHFVRVDIAGNISKRFTASGIRFARFSGACPRWNVHRAYLTPGQVRLQISQMPRGDTYFCLARTVERGGAGWRAPHTTLAIGLGVRIEEAGAMVYADGFDLERAARDAVPVGTTCRLCPRLACTQRAMPPLHAPLQVDENERGLSFYARPPEG